VNEEALAYWWLFRKNKQTKQTKSEYITGKRTCESNLIKGKVFSFSPKTSRPAVGANPEFY